MKKCCLLLLLFFLAASLCAQEAMNPTNPFLGTRIVLFKDKPMAFEVDFKSDMTYLIVGRFTVSPGGESISYMKLKEDNKWVAYAIKANNIEGTLNGDLFWFNTELTYMGGGPSSSIYLFIGDRIVAEVLPR